MVEGNHLILKEIILNYNPVSQISFEALVNNCAFKKIKANTLLSSENINDTSEYFLLSGIVHGFYTNPEGEHATAVFFLPGSVIMPNHARTYRGKSVISLETLLNVEIAEVPVHIFDDLRMNYEDLGNFGHKVVEQELLRRVRKETLFLTQTAKQRLINLREEYPNIENLVPHTIIASYLGITPVSFSRLRNDLATNRK